MSVQPALCPGKWSKSFIKIALACLFTFVFIISASGPAQAGYLDDPESIPTNLPRILSTACGRCYYVDSQNGDDSRSGRTAQEAWKTLPRLQAEDLKPGSTVLLKRGSEWTGGLVIDESGEKGKPILYTAYGEGEPPVIKNPGEYPSWTKGVYLYGDWIVLEGLRIQEAHEAGIAILEGADHNVIRNVEITDVGIGVWVEGQYNQIINNHIHDLHIVMSTPGGDDDFGAIGVVLANSYNEVAYNRFQRCIAPSLDYGVDGGAVEWWSTADYNRVHHNWASENDGFLEVGGGSAKHAVVAYNVSHNNGRFSLFNLEGKYRSEVEGFVIEGNTIIETGEADRGFPLFTFWGEPDETMLVLRDNQVQIERYKDISNSLAFLLRYELFPDPQQINYIIDPARELEDVLSRAGSDPNKRQLLQP